MPAAANFCRKDNELTTEAYAPESAPVKPEEHLTLVPSAEHRRRLGGISRATEVRRRKLDPAWPKPVIQGGAVYYVDAESKNYIRGLIASRDAGR
jgi:hypothetical protein